ncbi:hypothetical protein G7Y89_g9937 [Cudoniella acicularis]|uniref:C2H2-type domain-containing protein n=1 Tax=Cudoniella acicularis TaxID=354080 RepID=A0A8H4VZ71_9HELO|nr:hypothetical protein G7Y89_g9937 [Cudoniella acicularis]
MHSAALLCSGAGADRGGQKIRCIATFSFAGEALISSAASSSTWLHNFHVVEKTLKIPFALLPLILWRGGLASVESTIAKFILFLKVKPSTQQILKKMTDNLTPASQRSRHDSLSQDLEESCRAPPHAEFSTPPSVGTRQLHFKDNETSQSNQAPIVPDAAALSPISVLAKDCLKQLEGLCDIVGRLLPDKAEELGFDLDSMRLTVEDARARFKAWGTNIAAFRPRTLRTSLDFRLAEAPGIKRRTLQFGEATLVMLGEKPNQIWNPDDVSDSSEYSDEEDSQPENKGGSVAGSEIVSNLDEQIKAIIASNASLMKLSIVIRSSATRDDYIKAATRFNTWNPYPDISHVREKYGSAKQSTDWLLERLGKAITKRRQFLKYRVEHNEKMAGGGDDDETKREKPEKTIVASTKATTFIGENVLQNVRTAGSDTGNSFGSQTSYERTVFGSDGAPKMLTVPPPPKFAFPGVPFEYGEPFQCPYCFTEQIAKNKPAWKPYVCTFKGCEMLMFRSRNEWFAHELENHRREWVCQFCQHPAFSSLSEFSKHMKSLHKAVLASSPLEALILQSEEPVDKIASTACPLCDDWEASVKRTQANLDSLVPPSESTASETLYGKPKLFRRHLGRHMEQLALFALPPNDTEDLDNESSDENRENPNVPAGKQQAGEDESSNGETEDELEQIIESGRDNRTSIAPDDSAEPLVPQDDQFESGRRLTPDELARMVGGGMLPGLGREPVGGGEDEDKLEKTHGELAAHKHEEEKTVEEHVKARDVLEESLYESASISIGRRTPAEEKGKMPLSAMDPLEDYPGYGRGYPAPPTAAFGGRAPGPSYSRSSFSRSPPGFGPPPFGDTLGELNHYAQLGQYQYSPDLETEKKLAAVEELMKTQKIDFDKARAEIAAQEAAKLKEMTEREAKALKELADRDAREAAVKAAAEAAKKAAYEKQLADDKARWEKTAEEEENAAAYAKGAESVRKEVEAEAAEAARQAAIKAKIKKLEEALASGTKKLRDEAAAEAAKLRKEADEETERLKKEAAEALKKAMAKPADEPKKPTKFKYGKQ